MAIGKMKFKIKISDDKAEPVTGLCCDICRLPITLHDSTKGTIQVNWRTEERIDTVPHPMTGELVDRTVERRMPVYKGVRVCAACIPHLLAICPSCKGFNESHSSCRHCGESFAFPSFGSPEKGPTVKELIPAGNGRSKMHTVPVAMTNVFADYNSGALSGGSRVVSATEVRRKDLSRAFRNGRYFARGQSGKVKVIVRRGNVIDQETGRIARDSAGNKIKYGQ